MSGNHPPAQASMERDRLLEAIWECVDPRLQGALRQSYAHGVTAVSAAGVGTVPVALMGHRAAGKSRLLPLLAAWAGLPACDLDREVERRTGRAPADWFPAMEAGFRAAERAAFVALRPPVLVATGGGFLSHHADCLRGTLAVLIPLSEATYGDRLRRDRTRPRLRPDLPLDEELRQVFADRERAHGAVPTVPLVDFLIATSRSRGEAQWLPSSP